MSKHFSPGLEEVGRIEASNSRCDCGHPANFHDGFVGKCMCKECLCPFHSDMDPLRWDREMDVIHTASIAEMEEAFDRWDWNRPELGYLGSSQRRR